MSILRTTALWVSAVGLLITPVLLSVDFGGVYHWSQYVAALAILCAGGIALPGVFDPASSGLRQHALLLPLAVLAGLAWLHTVEMPAGIVHWLSPGSHDAYTQWLGKISPAEAPTTFPISLSAFDSAHVARLLTILLVVAWTASLVFHSRNRLILLLSSIALAGASVALLGFYRKLDPTADLWFFQSKSNSFGGFVNRNNAALMLNFGLAASLGLLSWRTMALHNIELDGPDFEFNDLFSLISDRDSFIGLFSATTCVAGLLVNGSRGGFVAALCALVVAFGYVQPRRGLVSLPILAVVLACSVAILTVPMKLNLESIQRLELISKDADTLQKDGRLLHWQDGSKAAFSYLPLGAGLSTYGFAYLPFQEKSPGGSFIHADNLWLEMIVETGIVGPIILLLIIWQLIVSLRRLGYSVDPIDQGLRIAGWYAIAVILVSQAFDFGLIIPANLIIAVILGSAIISRDIANGGQAVVQNHEEMTEHDYWNDESETNPSPQKKNKIRLLEAPSGSLTGKLTGRLVISTALAISILGAGFLVATGLRSDASSDALATRLRDEYQRYQFDKPALEAIQKATTSQVNSHGSPDLQGWLIRIDQDLARLEETVEWNPKDLEQAKEVYQAISLRNRELPYPPQPVNQRLGSPPSLKHYSKSWDQSLSLLQTCPLSQRARGEMLRLSSVLAPRNTSSDRPASETPASQIANGSVTQTSLSTAKVIPPITDQLASLYARSPQRLLDLAFDSINRGDFPRSEALLLSALQGNGRLASRVMPLFPKHRELNISNVIPEDPTAMRIAAAEVLKWETIDSVFLEKASTIIRPGDGFSLRQRASCEALVGEIFFQLKEDDRGAERYQRGIRLAPELANIRLSYIEHLRRLGNRRQALLEARKGRQAIPDNPNFQKIIDQMAESDRKELVQPNDKQKQTLDVLEEILK